MTTLRRAVLVVAMLATACSVGHNAEIENRAMMQFRACMSARGYTLERQSIRILPGNKIREWTWSGGPKDANMNQAATSCMQEVERDLNLRR